MAIHIRGQVGVLRVSFQQTLAFQKAADTVGNSVRQSGEFHRSGRFDPAESG